MKTGKPKVELHLATVPRDLEGRLRLVQEMYFALTGRHATPAETESARNILMKGEPPPLRSRDGS
jgi:hypothetical protein